MSASAMGKHKIFSPEHRAKINAAMKSAETREKLSVIRERLWQNSDFRARWATRRSSMLKVRFAKTLRDWWKIYGQGPGIGREGKGVPIGSTHHVQGRMCIKTKTGWRFRAHVAMEQMIRRPLLSGEVIHHINGIIDDDCPDNLELFASQAEHTKRHKSGATWKWKSRGSNSFDERGLSFSHQKG